MHNEDELGIIVRISVYCICFNVGRSRSARRHLPFLICFKAAAAAWSPSMPREHRVVPGLVGCRPLWLKCSSCLQMSEAGSPTALYEFYYGPVARVVIGSGWPPSALSRETDYTLRKTFYYQLQRCTSRHCVCVCLLGWRALFFLHSLVTRRPRRIAVFVHSYLHYVQGKKKKSLRYFAVANFM